MPIVEVADADWPYLEAALRHGRRASSFLPTSGRDEPQSASSGITIRRAVLCQDVSHGETGLAVEIIRPEDGSDPFLAFQIDLAGLNPPRDPVTLEVDANGSFVLNFYGVTHQGDTLFLMQTDEVRWNASKSAFRQAILDGQGPFISELVNSGVRVWGGNPFIHQSLVRNTAMSVSYGGGGDGTNFYGGWWRVEFDTDVTSEDGIFREVYVDADTTNLKGLTAVYGRVVKDLVTGYDLESSDGLLVCTDPYSLMPPTPYKAGSTVVLASMDIGLGILGASYRDLVVSDLSLLQ